MRSQRLAIFLTILTVAVAVAFVAYALTGSDLCVWCRAGQ